MVYNLNIQVGVDLTVQLGSKHFVRLLTLTLDLSSQEIINDPPCHVCSVIDHVLDKHLLDEKKQMFFKVKEESSVNFKDSVSLNAECCSSSL